MTFRFQRRLETLYGLERHKDRLGLDGTRALLGALGDPHRRFRSVHVAGTNGKGSTCALIERVLREAGIRTGLYTSPHLVDFRERIRVNGRWVDEGWLDEQLARIESLPEGKDRTFFEVCTALAFSYFAQQGVEIAVVETGLGGRLDCTNVITPEVSVITSVDYDHMEILGETLEQIAFEKAGVIKAGVPVVENVVFTSVREVIRRTAKENGSPLFQADHLAKLQPSGARDRLACRSQSWGLLEADAKEWGPLQYLNCATALAALEVLHRHGLRLPKQAVLEGLTKARWPGRLERCPGEPRLWWDSAHNREAFWALMRVWHATGAQTPSAVVLALSRDKELADILNSLAAIAPGARLIATRSRSQRAMEPERIAEVAEHGSGGDEPVWEGGWSAEMAPDVATACRRALENASSERPILLTGSLFAVGEAMEAFGGAPGEQL